MSKNKNNKQKEIIEKTIVNYDPIVLVRVISNFNDATDNERFISAGPNTFYRTNKSRADKLVKAGYAEYVEEIVATIVDDSNNADSDIQEDKTKADDNKDDKQEENVDPKADDEEKTSKENIEDNLDEIPNE